MVKFGTSRRNKINLQTVLLLNPWCRVLLEKLTSLQLVKKFPAFHGTRRFITALTSVRHLSLSWGQPNPVHIPKSHLLEFHPNIIHPSTSRSPQWSPSLRFPQQDPIHPSLLTHTPLMPGHFGGQNKHIEMRAALFWNITQQRVVFQYRRFGTTHRSHFKGSNIPKKSLDFLALEDGAEVLFRKVDTELPLYAS